MHKYPLQVEGAIARLRATVLGPQIDSFIELEATLGYTPLSVRSHLRALAAFARWLEKHELRVGDLNEGMSHQMLKFK